MNSISRLATARFQSLFASLALLLLVSIVSPLVAQQIPHQRYSPDFSSSDPYALDWAGETQIESPGFEYHHWGVMMDEDVFNSVPNYLYFTPLTQGPFNENNPELFITNSINSWQPYPLPNNSIDSFWAAPFGSVSGYISFFALNPLQDYFLIRKYHFPPTLYRDTLETPNFDVGSSSRVVTSQHKKLIVLIHGWNTGSSNDSYDEPVDDKEFLSLRRNIGTAIKDAPDWSLVLYRWAADADTGPKSLEINGDFAIAGRRNGSEAAESGHRHGKHLGQLLTNSGVEKVHFIAHSAGTWVARSAAERILRNLPNAKVQVTVLDPFIPGAMGTIEGPRTSGLTKARIDAIKNFGPAGAIFRLENYYSKDITDAVASDATSQVFSWRSGDENGLKVGGFPDLGIVDRDPYGDYFYGHFGPIQYYADTVHMSSGQSIDSTVSYRIANAGLGDQQDLNTWGWRRSIFYNEPIVNPTPTVTESVGGGKTITGRAYRRGSGSQTGIQFRWEVSTTGTSSWQPFKGMAFGNTPILNLTSADVAVGKRYFRLVAETDAGFDTGNAVQIGTDTTPVTPPATTTPLAPTNLVATAVSASQINLQWKDNSNNETSFKLQRRPALSSAWTDLPTAAANGTAFANTAGLSPATAYAYRVAAFNSVGTSAYSSEATAITLALAPPARQLTVSSVNPAGVANFSVNPTPAAIGAGGLLSFPHGTTATLTAPASVNGNLFQRWEKDGSALTTAQAASVLMDGNHALVMVFAPPAVPGVSVNLTASVAGGGSVSGGGSYPLGAQATISATAASGFHFVNWTRDQSWSAGGEVFTASPTFGFQVTGSLNLIANFSSTTGNIAVAITSDPVAGGATSGAGNYQAGQTATLTATPASGWEFGTWTENGTVVSFSPTFNVAVVQTHNYVANFRPDLTKNYTLAITANNGTAIRNPNQVAYSPGTVVTVTATPASGYYFSGWSGDASGTQNPLSVTMTANKAVTANFTAVPVATYTLTLPARTGGAVTKNPDLPFYTAGAVVTLTASPTSGYVFSSWRRDSYGASNPLQVTMDRNKTAVADFIPTSPGSAVLVIEVPFNRTVSATADSSGNNGNAHLSVRNQGSGTMYWSASPTVSWLQVNSTGGNGINGGSSSGLAYSWEENPTLSQRTGEIYVYSVGAQQNPQIYTITQLAGVPKHPLTVTSENGTVAKSPNAATYSQGTSVTLTATPTTGYGFIGWSGDASGVANPINVTINGATNVTANFVRLLKPDLIGSVPNPLPAVIRGAQLDVSALFRNRGTDPSNAVRAYFRVSSSSTVAPTVGGADEQPYVDIPGLIADQTHTTATSVPVPAASLGGENYLWVIVDPAAAAGEQSQDQANNRSVIPITVLPDTILPSVAITAPTPPRFVTGADNISLAGTAADNVQVATVEWTNGRGGTGTASGTTAWQVQNIPLLPGENVINVNATDTSGNKMSALITVRRTVPDIVPPLLEINFPTSAGNFAVRENQVSLAGTASDDEEIVNITWTNDRGGQGIASGSAIWTVNGVSLQPGINILTLTVRDGGGNTSSDILSVQYVPITSPLALTTAGDGTPSLFGKPNLAAMEVGKLYTADAKPAKGWIFAGWEGSVVSNSKRVSFVMEEGATLHAVFVENLYDEIAAVYRGLLRADPLAHSTSGDVTLTLTKSGDFTAQFTIGGEKLRLKGAFDGTGTFLGRLKGDPTLDVLLALDTATPDAPVTGLLSDGTTTMALNAWPAVKFPRSTPAAQAGEYTLAIEPSIAPAPLGSGFGTVRVSPNGGVKIKGRLANGAKFSAGTAITSGNRVPLYVSLDKGSGSFSAPIAFADKPDSDLDGIAFWSSAREQSAKYPFAPFTSEPRLFAQRYTAPARGARALSSLNATSGAATLTLGTHTQTLTLGTDNRLTLGNPLLEGFKLELSVKTGEFSGSLMLDGERVKFGGVLLEKSGDGVGSLPDAAVTLEP